MTIQTPSFLSSIAGLLFTLLSTSPALAEVPSLIPEGWDPVRAGDVVMERLVTVTAPAVKGAHDAEMVLFGDHAYIVAEVNDLGSGESAAWPEIYSVLSIVRLDTLAVEAVIPVARSEEAFENETLPVGACFVPRIIQKDDKTLRCYFASEQPGKRQTQMWFRDFDLGKREFAPTIHRVKLKTAAGVFDMQPQHFHADAVAQGFTKPAKDYGMYLFDSFKTFDGQVYVALNNFVGKQNALARMYEDFATVEVLGHFNEPQAQQLSESAVNRLPDGTWMAICRNDSGNYHFTTSVDGVTWTVGKEREFVPNGANSKPTFDKFGDLYYLGWQEATKIQGVHRSVFNVDVSRDGKTWERKYRFESPKSFQYPTFREHDGAIWVCATQGDHSQSRKERIVFGKLEETGAFESLHGQENPRVSTKLHRSSDLGWKAGQDVTEAFQQLLESGKLNPGEELRLEHTFRISGSHRLPDDFTISAAEDAGFDVTDAADPNDNRPLLELGNGAIVRNLTITYLNTPPLGPTGEKHDVNFTRRLGIQAREKNGIRIENCRLKGSIGHHLKFTDCSDIEVIATHVAGGHWSVLLTGCDKLVFRRCVIEQCQGDGIKTGGGASGAVRRVLVEDCVFQDNLRDGIDTTGGFNDSVIRNCVFRRLGTSGLDLKSHYESRTGKIGGLAPENIGILVERCLFHDMPNALVITTLDCGRRSGPGNELLNATNMKDYAPHDIEVNDCVFGHAEKPLRSSREGGFGVNYPSDQNEHMRMILLKDAYDVRYRNARFFGERILPVHVSSIGGSNHLSEEAARAIEPTISGTIGKPASPIQPGQTEIPFECGPKPL